MSIDARLMFRMVPATHNTAHACGPCHVATMRTVGDLIACDDSSPKQLHADVIAAISTLDTLTTDTL